MKRILMAFAIGSALIIVNCTKPCKNPDMSINEMDISTNIDMASIDACQINPATELCLDLRKND